MSDNIKSDFLKNGRMLRVENKSAQNNSIFFHSKAEHPTKYSHFIHMLVDKKMR